MSAAVNTRRSLTLDALDPLGGHALPLRGRGRAAAGGRRRFVDWRLCGQLSRLLVDGFFKGTRGESLLLPSNGRIRPPAVVVLGLGPGARRFTRACSGRRCPRRRTCSTVQGWTAWPWSFPGAARCRRRSATSAFDEAFIPAFRGSRVTLLADGPARPSR